MITLTEKETLLLKTIIEVFVERLTIEAFSNEGVFLIRIPANRTNNHIEICYDKNLKDLIVLTIGDWCHCHPESVAEVIELIERIIDDKIHIWKVTRPNGYVYAGFYDIDEWKENKDYVNERITIINGRREGCACWLLWIKKDLNSTLTCPLGRTWVSRRAFRLHPGGRSPQRRT